MPALPWPDLPGFMAQLAARDAIAASALQFAILTCARSGEVRGARWSEIDFAAKVWALPKERMKARRAHRVPLTNEAIALLEKVSGLDSDLVLPSAQRGKGGTAKVISDMAFKALFGRMGIEGISVQLCQCPARSRDRAIQRMLDNGYFRIDELRHSDFLGLGQMPGFKNLAGHRESASGEGTRCQPVPGPPGD